MKSSEISSVTVGTKFKCEYKMTSGLQPTNFSHRNSIIRISLVHILHPRLVQYWLLYHTMVGITKLCVKIMRPLFVSNTKKNLLKYKFSISIQK